MGDLNGQVAVFFVLVVAAAEVVVGLAIIVAAAVPPHRWTSSTSCGAEAMALWGRQL